MSSCAHDKDKEAIISRHTKIIFKIYSKIKVLVATTYTNITFDNFSMVLTIVMRELQKYNLDGYSKHSMAVEIMALLLETMGLDPVISHFTGEIISRMIEHIYVNGLHRYKRPHKLKFWKR